MLVAKFFHEKANENFVRKLKFVRRIDPLSKNFSEVKNIGRALFLYKSELLTNVHIIYHENLDWQFPDKYSDKIGLPIRSFEFICSNLENSVKTFIEQSPTLANSGSGQEETTTVLTRDIFFPEYKGIGDNIKNYKNTPTTHYINESHFLYDKSNLIKDTFITALNKKILIYGSIGYFNTKTENEIFRIVPPEEFLKFYVDKDVTRNSLSF